MTPESAAEDRVTAPPLQTKISRRFAETSRNGRFSRQEAGRYLADQLSYVVLGPNEKPVRFGTIARGAWIALNKLYEMADAEGVVRVTSAGLSASANTISRASLYRQLDKVIAAGFIERISAEKSRYAQYRCRVRPTNRVTIEGELIVETIEPPEPPPRLI